MSRDYFRRKFEVDGISQCAKKKKNWLVDRVDQSCVRDSMWNTGCEKKRDVRRRCRSEKKCNSRFVRDRKIRSSDALQRNVFAKKKTGVVRLLMCGDTCRQGRETAPGGCKMIPEVTLCRQSPRVHFLFRRRPAIGRQAWWNRLSFLGKCSSAAYLGKPVQVCGKIHNSVSYRIDDHSRWMPAAAFIRSESPVCENVSHCGHYILPRFHDYYLLMSTCVSLTSCWASARHIIIKKLRSGFFIVRGNVIINGNLTNGRFDDWILL